MKKVLNFLVAHGVTNLRVLAVAEGEGKEEDLPGDPPVEEQGLNSVFDSDTSTWNIINSFAKKIKNISAPQ